MSLHQLNNFLKAREGNTFNDYRYTGRCHHGSDEWCGNCIAVPEPMSVNLGDGKISTGYIMGNAAHLAKEILKDSIVE